MSIRAPNQTSWIIFGVNMGLKDCNIIHLPEVTSTNAYARELLRTGKPPEGTVVAAGFQTAGRGQDGNAWESEAGQNILMTMILYPEFLDVSKQFILSMTMALGIVDFLKDYLPDDILFIKWPNDIYAGDSKIGGILINNEIMGQSFDHVIAGIGINVNQLVFGGHIPNPVSLGLMTGKTYPVMELTTALTHCLHDRYEQLRRGEYRQIEAEYYGYLLGMDEWREYTYGGSVIMAMITGVDDFGKLMLETEGGMLSCDLKEIVYRF
jgi:BirA family biotin operon repressor/biotin-[acetyl-CoA-carboxylase] ligase